MTTVPHLRKEVAAIRHASGVTKKAVGWLNGDGTVSADGMVYESEKVWETTKHREGYTQLWLIKGWKPESPGHHQNTWRKAE